jgi:antitoxin ParD1/3/4
MLVPEVGAYQMSVSKIVVTKEQRQRVGALVGAGLFESEHDVLNEALALVEAKQARHAEKVEALVDAAQVGIDDIEAGRFQSFNTPEELEAFILKTFDEGVAEAKLAGKSKSSQAKAA